MRAEVVPRRISCLSSSVVCQTRWEAAHNALPDHSLPVILGLLWSDFVLMLNLVCSLSRGFEEKPLTNVPLPLRCPKAI